MVLPQGSLANNGSNSYTPPDSKISVKAKPPDIVKHGEFEAIRINEASDSIVIMDKNTLERYEVRLGHGVKLTEACVEAAGKAVRIANKTLVFPAGGAYKTARINLNQKTIDHVTTSNSNGKNILIKDGKEYTINIHQEVMKDAEDLGKLLNLANYAKPNFARALANTDQVAHNSQTLHSQPNNLTPPQSTQSQQQGPNVPSVSIEAGQASATGHQPANLSSSSQLASSPSTVLSAQTPSSQPSSQVSNSDRGEAEAKKLLEVLSRADKDKSLQIYLNHYATNDMSEDEERGFVQDYYSEFEHLDSYPKVIEKLPEGLYAAILNFKESKVWKKILADKMQMPAAQASQPLSAPSPQPAQPFTAPKPPVGAPPLQSQQPQVPQPSLAQSMSLQPIKILKVKEDTSLSDVEGHILAYAKLVYGEKDYEREKKVEKTKQEKSIPKTRLKFSKMIFSENRRVASQSRNNEITNIVNAEMLRKSVEKAINIINSKNPDKLQESLNLVVFLAFLQNAKSADGMVDIFKNNPLMVNIKNYEFQQILDDFNAKRAPQPAAQNAPQQPAAWLAAQITNIDKMPTSQIISNAHKLVDKLHGQSNGYIESQLKSSVPLEDVELDLMQRAYATARSALQSNTDRQVIEDALNLMTHLEKLKSQAENLPDINDKDVPFFKAVKKFYSGNHGGFGPDEHLKQFKTRKEKGLKESSSSSAPAPQVPLSAQAPQPSQQQHFAQPVPQAKQAAAPQPSTAQPLAPKPPPGSPPVQQQQPAASSSAPAPSPSNPPAQAVPQAQPMANAPNLLNPEVLKQLETIWKNIKDENIFQDCLKGIDRDGASLSNQDKLNFANRYYNMLSNFDNLPGIRNRENGVFDQEKYNLVTTFKQSPEWLQAVREKQGPPAPAPAASSPAPAPQASSSLSPSAPAPKPQAASPSSAPAAAHQPKEADNKEASAQQAQQQAPSSQPSASSVPKPIPSPQQTPQAAAAPAPQVASSPPNQQQASAQPKPTAQPTPAASSSNQSAQVAALYARIGVDQLKFLSNLKQKDIDSIIKYFNYYLTNSVDSDVLNKEIEKYYVLFEFSDLLEIKKELENKGMYEVIQKFKERPVWLRESAKLRSKDVASSPSTSASSPSPSAPAAPQSAVAAQPSQSPAASVREGDFKAGAAKVANAIAGIKAIEKEEGFMKLLDPNDKALKLSFAGYAQALKDIELVDSELLQGRIGKELYDQIIAFKETSTWRYMKSQI